MATPAACHPLAAREPLDPEAAFSEALFALATFDDPTLDYLAATHKYVLNLVSRPQGVCIRCTPARRTAKPCTAPGHELSRDTCLLLEAVAFDNGDVIQHFVDMGCEVNIVNCHGDTPLHAACGDGKLEAAKALIRLGASAAVTDIDGDSPLGWACEHGDLDTVKFLVKCGCAPAHASKDGWTGLHYAARAGAEDVVSYLIKTCKVDVDTRSLLGATALMFAAEEGHLPIVKVLTGRFRCDASVTDAGSCGSLCDPNEAPFPCKQCFSCPPALVCLGGCSALHFAADNGHLDCVSHLVSVVGVDVDLRTKEGRTVLLQACERGYWDMVDALLTDMSADLTAVDQNGDNALHLAVEYGHEDIVRLLLHNGVPVNAKNYVGESVVIMAAVNGNAELVRLLAESYSANLGTTNKAGESAMHLAALFDHQDVVGYLLDHAPELASAGNLYGDLPGHYAAVLGRSGMLRLLLAAAPESLNAQNADGETLLHRAVRYNAVETVSMLVEEYGADTTLRNMHGKVASMYTNGKAGMIELCHRLGLPTP